MRATATASLARNGKRRLLESCALAAGLAALAHGGPAMAQVAGTGTIVSGAGTPNGVSGTTTTTTVTQTQNIINWVPNDSAPTGGDIDLLPAGSTWNFVGDGDYTVLNRFVDAGGGSLGRQIALNGTVNSYVGSTTGSRGGNIWFYNGGGILIGASGVINVGSLVLTTNDISTAGSTISFNGAAGSNAAVTVNGAINANNDNPGGSYVALVAPRVVQAGAVRVDGSAAYVAAEQVDIRINGGLFDINVIRGANGGNVITHTGTTTGPAHQDGDTDQNRIYMVAIPKNDAVTMLVSGAIGYDDAVSATEADGAIRLSAGYNIVGGELAAAPANGTAANITAGDTLFRSNTTARASGTFTAGPTQQLPGSPPPLSSAGQFFVEGSGTFIGDASATLNIGTGQSGGATGSLAIVSGGTGATAGNAAINVTGGILSTGSGLTVNASGTPQALTGNSQGGTASLTITGGAVNAAAVTVEASGFGIVGTNGSGGSGTGGNASISVSNAGSTLIAPNIFINAVGTGATSFSTAPDVNGDGRGGSASLTVADGGAVGPAALLAIDASGTGGLGLVQSGDGFGGTARIAISGAGSSLSTTQSFIDAEGAGGRSSGSFLTLNGGDGTGGTAEVIVNADAASNLSLGNLSLFAIGRGGRADGENAIGGSGVGGTARLTADGGATVQLGILTLDASVPAGSGNSSSGTTGRTGNAQAGTTILSAANGSTIASTGDMRLFAVGMGTAGENFGTGNGGTVTVTASAGGTIEAGNSFVAQAMGGSMSGTIERSAGNAVAGDIDFLADGGTIRAEVYRVDASANTVNVLGTGGTAQGGTIDVRAQNGGQFIATLDATNVFNAGATAGASAAGTAATGGAIRLVANAGTINLGLGADLSASGTAGGATTSGATGPLGLGGSILVRIEADPLNSGAISFGNLFASADGRTEAAYEAFPGLPRETGGNGRGGTMAVDIQGGSFSGGSVGLSADGFGGNASGGNTGTGGTAAFTQTGGSVNVSDLTVSADGLGSRVSGQSGSGIGGSATIGLSGGTTTAADIIARANGIGGAGTSGDDNDPLNIIAGGRGGAGQGGTATIDIGGTAVVDASILQANATGTGGTGGDFFNVSSFSGVPGPTGNGGDGTGGNATVNVTGGTTTTSSMIADASGIGGTGGSSSFSSSSGGATGVGVGGTGGNGQGGTATIALAAAIDGVGIARAVAQGQGGDGGTHNVGGNGGNGAGGIAQAIVTGFDAGALGVTVDASGQGGDGADGNDGDGGNGGSGAGGTARMRADGAGAALTVTEANFISEGIGGDGGDGQLGFGAFEFQAPSGGNGGAGQGGTIETVADEGATVTLGLVSGDSVLFSSIGRGGGGGAGSNSIFDAEARAGDGGDGGAGTGGTVRLVTGGGAITSNGESVDIEASGVSGETGVGGIGQGGAEGGADGALSATRGGRVAIEALDGVAGPGQIALGNTSITANGDAAGRIELRAQGNLGFAGLDATALGTAPPTNNDTDVAPAGIFAALDGGTITSQGDVVLNTDSSVGIHARSNGIFDVDGALTINAGDQIDVRHESREGAAPTIRASDSLVATALNSISGAPGSSFGAGDQLVLTATGITGTIGVDRLEGAQIVIDSSGAASVEHAEAANDFTASVGSFRTGLNSIITGGDIVISSPGAVDLGNSDAGGFVSVGARSIAFNNIVAGSSVSLSASGTAPGAEGISGGSITSGGSVDLNATRIAIDGTVRGDGFLFASASAGGAAINAADFASAISVSATGDISGAYSSGGNIRLNSGANINASANAIGSQSSSSGPPIASSVYADAAGDVTLANSEASGMFGVNAGGAASLTGVVAGEDLLVRAGTTATLANVSAGDDLTVRAVGNIVASGLLATGTGSDGQTLFYNDNPAAIIGFGVTTSAPDGSNIDLASSAGDVGANSASAFDNLTVVAAGAVTSTGLLQSGLATSVTGNSLALNAMAAGTDIILDAAGSARVEHAEADNDFTATAGSFATGLNSIITGGDIVVTSPGAVDLGNSTAGGFVQVTGQSIAFNSVNAGLTVGLSATGTAAGAEGISGGSIAAGGDINLFGNSIALTGPVTGDRSFFAFGTGGAVSVNGADVAGTISIFSATNLTGTYVAGGDIFLNSNGNIAASAQANGGYVDGNGIGTDGNLFVVAAGDAALTDSSAARMFGVNAGLSASVDGGTAGEDVLVLAGTTANLNDVTGGDDVTVRAPGNITAVNVRTTGTGADTSILDFSNASGSPTFTIGSGEGTQGVNGADIVIASAAGAIDAAALSAGDDILLNAANTIAVNGATTLGLGTTGGDSSIRTQGGATTLAGLDAFSDVVVNAAGLANLTGTVAAGRDATINAADVTLAVLAAPGGGGVPTLSADGAVIVNSSSGITGGGVRALGDTTLTAGTAIDLRGVEGNNVTLTGTAGVAVDAVSALGATSLDSSNGDIAIGSLLASGPIAASANAIRIDGGGDMSFTTLTADVGDAIVRSSGDLSVASGNVAGTADFATQGEAMTIGSLTAANARLENSGGFVNLDAVTVAGNLAATARTTLGINGVVTGQSIALASANINIAPTGRVGTAGVTQQLSVANNNVDNQTFVGGPAGTSVAGYQIDADELTRLYGTNIEIFAPEVQAAGGGSVGSAAPPDMIVDSFTMAGGASGSNLGTNGALTLRTPGKMRVVGNVRLTGLSDTNALNLFADDALEVILGQGTVRLLGANDAPGGQLDMASDDIIVATEAAIAAVGTATTIDAVNARLAQNDGVVLDEGALFARGIRAEVVGGFYVQNSGAGTEPVERRGLTFGAGGLDVVTQGPSRIVVNGVQIGPNGQVTGIDAISLLTIAGAAPAPGRFNPRSTFNGCFIANPNACASLTVDIGTDFPVQDVIEEEADADGEGEGNNLPTPLITMRDLDPLSGEPLVDDPVTGAGNDDLWTTPGE